MTTHPRPETREAHDLPATLEGLWTAVTETQETAARLRALAAGRPTAALDAMIGQCESAAGSLADSRAGTLTRVEVARDPEAAQLPGGAPHLASLITDCLDLALGVLGNEDEPLTPAEILAVTRSVTALCAARQSAIEVAP